MENEKVRDRSGSRTFGIVFGEISLRGEVSADV